MAAWIFTLCLNVHNPPAFLQCAWNFTICLNFYTCLNFHNPPEFYNVPECSQSAEFLQSAWIFPIGLNFYNVPEFSQSSWIFTMSRTDSVNIFYQPRPACCKTGKDWEGGRDTGRTGKGCQPARIAWGYSLCLLTRQAEESNPPPPTDTLLVTSLRL